MSEDAAYVGGNHERSPVLPVVQGSRSDLISSTEQRADTWVPDRIREVAEQMAGGLATPPSIRPHRDFGVGDFVWEDRRHPELGEKIAAVVEAPVEHAEASACCDGLRRVDVFGGHP